MPFLGLPLLYFIKILRQFDKLGNQGIDRLSDSSKSWGLN